MVPMGVLGLTVPLSLVVIALGSRATYTRHCLARVYRRRSVGSGLLLTSWLGQATSVDRVPSSHWLRQLAAAWILKLHQFSAGASKAITFTRTFRDSRRAMPGFLRELCCVSELQSKESVLVFKVN